MLNKFVKVALVSTSFSPILLTYAFILWLEEDSILKFSIVIGLAALLVFLCLLIINFAKKKLEIINLPIQSIKTADGEVVGFLVAYLLPFTTIASEQINESILIFIMSLFFLIIWSTNSYHINPLLSVFGYHFYEVNTSNNISFLLITKRDLRDTTSITSTVQLTEYMVLDINNKGDKNV
ncbi:hypothetical protein [Salipaludibacillus aurantiacus]|uniref:Uncharacterized protein n=1 Tax=Salipaludibacillus aurantiacus TaxID=1601833 RepID=A0A1H9Q1Q8_9BACI|nr:hypothetical protein [Salipaludibacillus aurantiacus]SER54338.1 hypothetical protein SAMN05518684_1026 [Salipaludibacillus aurantiacus]